MSFVGEVRMFWCLYGGHTVLAYKIYLLINSYCWKLRLYFKINARVFNTVLSIERHIWMWNCLGVCCSSDAFWISHYLTDGLEYTIVCIPTAERSYIVSANLSILRAVNVGNLHLCIWNFPFETHTETIRYKVKLMTYP